MSDATDDQIETAVAHALFDQAHALDRPGIMRQDVWHFRSWPDLTTEQRAVWCEKARRLIRTVGYEGVRLAIMQQDIP